MSIWWVNEGERVPQSCRTTMLYCLGQYIAGKRPEPPPVSQPETVRLAQTLEVERHLGLGLDSGFLLVNRNPLKCFQLSETGCSPEPHTPWTDAINGNVFLEGENMSKGFQK